MAESKTTVKKVTKKAATPVEAVKAVKETAKKSAVKVDVLDLTGKVVESISLPEAVFGVAVNKPLMAQAVRVYLANQRTGNASTKSRGEVDLTKAKAWRQKGTGRARHGAKSAPIWVGGGVAHGPKPHDFSLVMPQKMRQRALFSALTAKVKANELTVVTGIEAMEPKTKNFAAFLKAAELQKKSVLLVLPEVKGTIARAVRNVEGVTYVHAVQLNTYEVLRSKRVLVMKDAVKVLENHFLKEKKHV